MSENEGDQIRVLWSDEQVMAILKPPALATQAPPKIDSLEVRLRQQLTPSPPYLAFPHRLDRPVGGVILVATSKRAARLLGAQFESRKIDKTYVALVQGNLPVATGPWCDWLRKRPGEARVEIVEADADDAQRAETSVERLGYSEPSNCTLVRLRPVTGRMHQLRVQTSHRGYPILGDTTYDGSAESVPSSSGAFDSLHIALQAESIAFHAPRSGRRVVVTAPLSDAMLRIAATAGIDLRSGD